MPFWRRRPDETAAPKTDDAPAEAVDPENVPADWEPDPADFEYPADVEDAGESPDAGPIATMPMPDPEVAVVPPDAVPGWPVLEVLSIDIPLPTPVPGWPSAEAGAVPGWPSAEAGAVPGWPAAATPPDRSSDATGTATLDSGLERTRGGFMSRLRGFLGTAGGDGPSWDDVEETLIAGDVGAALAIDLVERARRRRDPGGPEAAIRAELAALLVPRELDWSPRSAVAGGPAVVLVVGVNGTGKTTTIGKLASRYKGEGRSVILAAADTFRAAAIDQLRIWADRAGVPMVAHAPGADPGAVVYDALDAAVARGADLVIADTAGRLHTRSNLMDELSKVRRIIDKRLPSAQPETIFVLDATTGQNGLAQAKAFHEAVGLTGIVLTKLDSTAKGGIVFAIEDALHVPVRFVGVGEAVGDLIPFDPDAFVAALFA
jgi:fused signal recognition particle receptor